MDAPGILLDHHALVVTQDGGDKCQRGDPLCYTLLSLKKIVLDTRSRVYLVWRGRGGWGGGGGSEGGNVSRREGGTNEI